MKIKFTRFIIQQIVVLISISISQSQYVNLSSGGNFNCIKINDNSSIKCWGDNKQGQTTLPYQLSLFHHSNTRFSLGTYHSCAILLNAYIKCWGDNIHGQSNPPDWLSKFEPDMNNLQNQKINHISSGSFHSCITTVNGEVECWGFGVFKQLEVPKKASGRAQQIASGLKHNCMLLLMNELYKEKIVGEILCFGDNKYGQTDIDPIFIQNTEISVGQLHTCLLHISNSIHCFGRNQYGELIIPKELSFQSIYDIYRLRSGFGHNCVVSSQNSVICWGWDDEGQLITGKRAEEISLGQEHTCVTNLGKINCQGRNHMGQCDIK